MDLRRANRCVLQALAAFHGRGFVHCDVRWPNVLRDPADGGSLLVDFELAAPIGSVLPARYHGSIFFPPETREGGAFTPAGDVWQVGQLVRAWATPHLQRVLSPAAVAFSSVLALEDSSLRPAAAAALKLDWLSPPPPPPS